MTNVVVIGSQWGDEGKGKIVDWLSERADIVVRFQGGHNAGHTLVIDGVSYKLSLLPSGVVRPGKKAVIGNGVVVDPHALIAEIGRLKDQGVSVTPDNLRIAENATLILSLHRELDGIREDANSGLKIGTTKRGIGPARARSWRPCSTMRPAWRSSPPVEYSKPKWRSRPSQPSGPRRGRMASRCTLWSSHCTPARAQARCPMTVAVSAAARPEYQKTTTAMANIETSRVPSMGEVWGRPGPATSRPLPGS